MYSIVPLGSGTFVQFSKHESQCGSKNDPCQSLSNYRYIRSSIAKSDPIVESRRLNLISDQFNFEMR